MAKQAKLKDSKIVDFSRDVIYASLGVQKTAYDYSVGKYTEFTKQRKKGMKSYIKRGEQVEAQLRDLYEEIKHNDNLVGKSLANVEQQVEKAVKLVVELSEKVAAVVPGRAPKKRTVKRASKAKTASATKRRTPAKSRVAAKRRAPAKIKAVRKAA